MTGDKGENGAAPTGNKRSTKKRRGKKRKRSDREQSPAPKPLSLPPSLLQRSRRRAGAAFALVGPAAAILCIAWTAWGREQGRWLYMVDSVAATLVRLWLMVTLWRALLDATFAEPRLPAWMAAVADSRRARLAATFSQLSWTWLVGMAAVMAATQWLHLPLTWSQAGVVATALAAATHGLELCGWAASHLPKRMRQAMGWLMWAGLLALIIPQLFSAMQSGVLLRHPLAAVTPLLGSPVWRWLLPARWVLELAEALANSGAWGELLVAPLASFGALAGAYGLRGAVYEPADEEPRPGIRVALTTRWGQLREAPTATLARGAGFAALIAALVVMGRHCREQGGTLGPLAADQPSWVFGGLPPGAQAHTAPLIEALTKAWSARPSDYRPRTKHVRRDGTPRFTNRLFLESSPYLRQHAHNPVNWFPWGDEAFELARALGRPVLLSVGYSTCHWCHVMEEESFEDVAIARYLNEHYVAIKVDREERPDVDSIYMAAVRALTGGGGWPMTVWLTPDRKPFYGGSYFPARDGDRGTSRGFITVLRKLRAVYDDEPERVNESSVELARTIRGRLSAGSRGPLVGVEPLRGAFARYAADFDDNHGGLDRSPKFPSSLSVRMLLRFHRRSQSEPALSMALLTLEKMAAGGMHDHVGGGFHRYSTDAKWLVPHFEKMLYDNALLALAYLEAYQISRRESFARVARNIFHYVARDMTSPEGGFYSATDADSINPRGHREEGWFFTWTPSELRDALGASAATTVERYYDVSEGGNFERRNILHTPVSLARAAPDLGMSEADLLSAIDGAREKLYQVRSKRPPPLRDEKILTAWNGLMISALSRGALVLQQPDLAQRAAIAADFVLTKLRKQGRLLRSYKDGHARHPGYLDDYAFLIAGLLDLHEATGQLRWLREAIALSDVVERHHLDARGGGYFLTSHDHEQLLAREKPAYDGAEPSGNSIHTANLLRLHELTGKRHYNQRAEGALKAMSGKLRRAPTALSEMLLALDFHLDAAKQIVLVAPTSRDELAPFLEELGRTFVPNRVVVTAVAGADLQTRSKLVPLLEGKVAKDGKPTAYVCERQVCELPTSDVATFAQQIAKVRLYE
jgi:uncharacterized protein